MLSGGAAAPSAPLVLAAMGNTSPLKSKTQPVSLLRTLPLTFGYLTVQVVRPPGWILDGLPYLHAIREWKIKRLMAFFICMH